MSELESHNRHETHGGLDATDASSFDDLAKGLASGTLSRRKALRMLGAAVVGGALASFPGMAWAAKPAGCPSGVKCKGQCCAVGATCAKGAGGACACPTGQIVCGGACVTNTCPKPGEAFNPVTCQCECSSTGEVLCNGACVSNTCSGDTVFDPNTCQCECPTGQVLCDNACVSDVCEAGQTFNQSTCQCEVITSTCVPGTNPCCTEGPNGGGCMARADNGEPICVVSGHCQADGSGAIVTDCSQCPEGTTCMINPPGWFVGQCGAFFCADTFCPS
jgi:hypothetical protein